MLSMTLRALIGLSIAIMTIPALAQTEVKITASDGAANDSFAASVSVDGNTAVIGSKFDDDRGSASGSAYVYSRNLGGADNWGEVIKLTASDGAAFDEFGTSVSVSGDIAVIGAYGDDGFRGSAYVYSRNMGGADNWGQVTKLTASDAAMGDEFGWTVSVDGDTAVIGAYLDNIGGSNNGVNRGSAYVYSRNMGGANNWGEVAKLTASDASRDDQFGISVSVNDDTAVIGAAYDDVPTNSGSVYVFSRNAGGPDSWGEVATLSASDASADDRFGGSVSVDGDIAVIGAEGDDDGGSAYVFSRDEGGPDNWGEVIKLTASDSAASDQFGYSVSVDGNTAVIGAYGDDDAGAESGSTYVFSRDEGGPDNWGEVIKLTASDAADGDRFGSVSVSGDTAVIGASQDDDGGEDSGSAYIFKWMPALAKTEVKMTASDAALGDLFGFSVSVDADTAVIGAFQDNDGGDGNADGNGSAYVYSRNMGGADSWGEVTKITASDAASGDQFGVSVSVDGDTAVIGAKGADGFTGLAYVFSRNSGGADNWGEVIRLMASDGTDDDQFGVSVSVNSDTAVIGAWGDDVGGSAYVFSRNAGGLDNWGEVAKLTASDTGEGDVFGYSVSVEGDTAVVGAFRHVSNSGSAYVFSRNLGGVDNWGQVTKVSASDAEANDWFGVSVSVGGDIAVIGAAGGGSAYVFSRNEGGEDNWGEVIELTASDAEVGNAFGISVSVNDDTAVIGAAYDDVPTNSGSAYVFSRNLGGPDNWGEVIKLTASDVTENDQFGISVSVDGDTAVIGAWGDDDGGSISGSAYAVFGGPIRDVIFSDGFDGPPPPL